MVIGYRLFVVFSVLLLIGAAASHGAAQSMRTTHPQHVAAPPAGLSLGGPGASMRTTESQRHATRLGDYLTTFDDGTEADEAASRDCAMGKLKLKKQGRYKARFIDRTVEAGTSLTVIDPNRRLLPETLYAFTNPGSTSCIVWRVTQ